MSIGYDLDVEGATILHNLATPHPKYDDRVNCRKATAADFMDRLRAHLEQASKYRADFNGQPGEGIAWNSVKGWCQYNS
jgi:hypothetical protein